MNPQRVKHYINRMLELSIQYEKDGNNKKAEYWLNTADEFEKRMKTKGDSNA